ncbi:MAG: Tol-Pal system beta propeller repeat protein TolB [Gammaproteobacteria bacterium]
MRKSKLVSLLSLAAVFLAGAGVARADLVIKITKGVNQPTPIAVVPFAWKGTGAAPVNVAKVVSDDLARSGLFAPLPSSQMLARPTASADVHFANWKAVNVNYLVIGSITSSGNDVNVRFRLFNVYTGRQLLGYELPGTKDHLRFTAHLVSDMIYQKLTGKRGAFATRIAYVQELGRNGPWQLVVADADGANPHVVVHSSGLLMSPDWSPDGKKIAYVEYEHNRSHIYVQNVATGQRKRVISHPGIKSAPVFSPQGNKLAVVIAGSDGNSDIYIYDFASGNLHRFTHSPAIDTEPAWMPDGQSLVFTSDRGGSPQIYEKRLGGERVQRLTWNGTYNTRATVAPDGKSIALVHRQHGRLEIGLLDLATGNLKILTKGPLDRSPTFAPNGALILYDSLEQDKHVLATVSVDNRVRTEISGNSGGLSQPAWGPFPPRPAARPAAAAPQGADAAAGVDNRPK